MKQMKEKATLTVEDWKDDDTYQSRIKKYRESLPWYSKRGSEKRCKIFRTNPQTKLHTAMERQKKSMDLMFRFRR